MPLIPIFLFILLLAVALVWWFWKKLTTADETPLLQDLSDPIPKEASYEIIPNAMLQSFLTSPIASNSLPHELNLCSQNQVKAIYLVHGTFVGNDPLHLISLMEEGLPESAISVIHKIRDNTKKAHDFFAKDLGNFTSEHVQLIYEASKQKIPVHNFTWSSGNHHFARLKGALDLIEHLNQQQFKTKDRIMLIGHSHAGQIFALLTQLINRPNMQNYFFEILENFDIPTEKYLPIIKKLKQIKFDIVTMGTPARYSWNLSNNMRLLHFINHRCPDVLGGHIKGFINTKDGDYIQQWGVQGSDIVSPIKKEKLINLELDQKLGVGSSLELFRQNILLRHRLHNQGHHYLIDYGDNSLTPNFLKTGFGHGVYTKIDLLSFHFHMFNKYFI